MGKLTKFADDNWLIIGLGVSFMGIAIMEIGGNIMGFNWVIAISGCTLIFLGPITPTLLRALDTTEGAI